MARFRRPHAKTNRRRQRAGSAPTRGAGAFLVAARGAWLSRAAPVAGRVYARWAMFLGLGSRGLTRRPTCAILSLARSNGNPAERASRTFSHSQNGLARFSKPSPSRWHRNVKRMGRKTEAPRAEWQPE
jgi:hypothetical protein